MPEIWFLPLDVPMPTKAEHLHAALSAWFDTETPDAPDRHHDNTKPYTISPPTQHRGRWGVEVSTVTPEASWRLTSAATAGKPIRLGHRQVRVGHPEVLVRASWWDLTTRKTIGRWVVDFMSPTTFRSGQRASPLPTPPVMLRGPIESWAAYSGLPPLLDDTRRLRELWVSRVDLETVSMSLRKISWPAVLGRIEVRSDDPSLSSMVEPLFALAPFCGVGSFRGKGFGVVRLARAA